jgi:O-antigen/teichoic acid export membrane protein
MSDIRTLSDRGLARSLRAAFREDHRATLGSVATTLGAQACMVLSGVLAARLLGVEDRGRFALLAIFPLVLAQLGGMGVPLAVTFRVASGHDSARAVLRAVRPLLLSQLALVLVAHVAVLVLVAFPGAPHRMEIAGLITLAWTPAVLLQGYAEAVLQGQERFRAFNLLRLAPSVFPSLMVGLAALAGQGNLVGIATVWTAGYILAAAASLVVAIRGTTGSRADGHVSRRSLVTFGLRGLLGSSSPLETFRLDQAVVGLVISQAALGIYVVAIAFTNLPRMVAQSVGMVAYPRVAAQTDARSARHALWLFALVGTAMCALIAGALEVVVGWTVPLFFGQEFDAAVDPCRILLVGSFFFGMRRVLSDGARGIGWPGLGSVAEIATWVVLLPSLLILAPRWGVDGVAFALTLAAAAGAVFVLAALVWTPRLRATTGVAA